MSDHTSDTDLPDFDRTQPRHSSDKSSSVNRQNGYRSSDGSHNTIPESSVSCRRSKFQSRLMRATTPTSPTFQHPDLSIPRSQPTQEIVEPLHLRPSALVADQYCHVAEESGREHGFIFQSPKVENKDFYDRVVDKFSAPILANRRRPESRTSPAPEGCACSSPRHSVPDEDDLDSIRHSNGSATSTQAPLAPVNSPHDDQPQQVNESCHGPPGSSSNWPHYWKPTGKDEQEQTIKCHDSDMLSGAEPHTALPRLKHSGWLEGKLERNKNTSSSSIHANVRNIDDVNRCPAAQPAQTVDSESSDFELEYWGQKHQEMFEDIQQVDAWEAQFDQMPALIAPKSLTSSLSKAECMVDMMDRKGFKYRPKWLAECSSAFELARRGNTYPLMAFAVAEFGELFARNEDSTSGNRQSQEQLDNATNKGVIDACQAVKSLMSICSSCPTNAWCKQYDALIANAQDCGDIEPLVEFVRCEAENISVRNASEKAAKTKESFRQSCNAIDLDESGTQIRSSLKNGPEVGYDDGPKGADSDYSHGEVHHEYGIRNTQNYQSEAEPFGNRFFYITNSLHPIVARLDNFETKQPFVVTLSHYFEEFRLLASVSIVALAVKVTPSEKQRSVDTYAEVWLRDSLYWERFTTPSRIEGFTAQGRPFNLNEDTIIAMIDVRLGDLFEVTAPRNAELDSASNPDTDGSSSSSASGITLSRLVSDQSQSKSPSSTRQPHIHLTPEETREMHPNVVAERGMTLVSIHDFPDLLGDQDNFTHYQLSVGASPSSVFISCERCHKTVASFDNVESAITVARREENEPGDTYIIISISSLDTIIDSVDKVKRVWLQIGTHKYFMHANEAGIPRTHDCISIQDTVKYAMEPQESEAAGGYYNQDEEEALGSGRLGDLPPQGSRAHGHQPFFEEGELEYDRHGDLLSYQPGHPSNHVQLPPSEDHQRRPQTIPSVRMPSSMQFLPLHPNFPTTELPSVREPCTIISVCEQRGIIHGVYQGLFDYRAIFRGPGERGHRVYVDIRDGLEGYIGRRSRIRHHKVGLMNSQVSTLTAEEEPEERINPMALPPQPDQGHNMGLRGGDSPVEDWANTEADNYWSDDEEMSLRGGANVDYSDSDDDVNPGLEKEEWLQTKTNAPTPESQQTGSISAILFSDASEEEMMRTGASSQKQTSQQASANASKSHADAGPKQRWIPTGVSAEPPKIKRKPCTCSSRKGKEPARPPSGLPGASAQPLMIIEGANSNDSVGPLKGKETAWDLIHGGAPEDVPTQNQQWASSMGHPSSLEGKEPAKALRDFPVSSPHQFVPSNDPPQPRLPQDGSERIPTWLQAGPQNDPDQVQGEEPVFTGSYKKWLRDMYTRPSNSTCGTNPAPGPSFQDFWQDREARRPATMADGSVLTPKGRPESEYHGAAVDEGKHIRMQSDGYVALNRKEASPFLQPFGSNARYSDQVPGRWHGADVDEDEHIRVQEEPPRTEEITSLNPALQNILNRYLRERTIYKARAASNATIEED